jgi:hypothetical protein
MRRDDAVLSARSADVPDCNQEIRGHGRRLRGSVRSRRQGGFRRYAIDAKIAAELNANSLFVPDVFGSLWIVFVPAARWRLGLAD